MIKANNIAELFDFIKKNRKSNTLNLNISKKGIIKTNIKNVSDITVKNNSILFNLKIDPILRQSCEILLPLIRKKDRVFIGQIGQSLDAKIALNNGNSHYINEKESITYLHCLRSISDGVLVGVNTIIKDNPLLTTRKIKGQNPTRLIIDPSLKLTNKYKIFKDKNNNIVFTTSNKTKNLNNTRIVKLPKKDFTLSIYKFLKKSSLKYILIEGGPTTLSHFIEQNLINYMQFIISPTLIGSGINSIKLKPITNLKKAIRRKSNFAQLGKEIVATLDFNS
tara:strand:- start:1063 stop:1899 length:837 start_codon:yes stop_codon:yes gene_type:complete